MPISLQPNVVIAERFRLNRQLGRGGMGSVWHATHLGLDVPCALKFIEGENALLPEAHARFEREAKAAAQLRSPHVVQILDHGVWQGTPYIAMELLDGEDLGKRLLRSGRLAPHEVVKIVSQVSRALAKAHAVGIVHRDLKPDNIFLVRDDDREIAKVLDFGIAKAAGNVVDGSATKTGAMLGTPYYMSPEQAQGTKAVDHRSDLWSLAVIVFQALTGRLPFESEALGDLLVKIIVTPVPVPSQMAGGLPPSFDAWWARASQRDPAQRFQSAKELADSLAMLFGQSQGTDMMERPGQALGFESRAAGPFAQTPPGRATVAMPLPSALATSPPPPMRPGTLPPTTPVPRDTPGTGAPMSRTFGGPPVSAPSARGGAGIAVGGAIAGLLVLAGLVTVVVLRGKAASPTAAASPPAATAAMTTTSPAASPPAVTLEPQATGSASPSASAPDKEPDRANPAATTSGAATGGAPTKAPNAGGAVPGGPRPPPVSTGKKKPIDLGI
jgi:serine/threonine-protein kinase